MRLVVIALLLAPAISLADQPSENVELTPSEAASMDSMADLASVPAAETPVVPQVVRVVSDPEKIAQEAQTETAPSSLLKVPKMSHDAPWEEASENVTSVDPTEKTDAPPQHAHPAPKPARDVANADLEIRVKTIPATKPKFIARKPQ